MVARSNNFDPQHQIIRRVTTTGTPPTSEPSSDRRPRKGKVTVKPEAQRLPEDVVLWEPCPEYRDNPHAQFAAQIATWIESYCFIRIKGGSSIKLRFNRSQFILMQFVAWRWVHGLPAKAITPKARQLGSSTFWDALLYAMCENKEGYQAAIVAHDDSGIDQLWGKIETIRDNLYRTSWGVSKLINDAAGKIKWKSQAMLFSGLIRSADALGKGGSPNGIHFSEVANFNDKGLDAEEGIASILSAMSESIWTIEIYESTAKGKDKTFYARCEDARNPESLSDLTLIFLPWYLDEGYVLSWAEYRRRLVSSGKKDPGPAFKITPDEKALRDKITGQKVLDHEKGWKHRHYLTDEQLIYYRWNLVNRCKGKPEVQKRYYPSTYEECFTASTEAAFDAATIEYYRALSKPPLLVGNLVKIEPTRKLNRPTYQILPNEAGYVKLWQYPHPGVPYLVGADPGGSTLNADPCNAYVMNKLTKEVVAQVHGHMQWDEFTRLLNDLGRWYNNALLIVENNYNPAIAHTLHQWAYPNLYYYFPENTIDPHVGKVPGFNSNKKTRKEISALIRAYAKARMFVCWDEHLAPEMENFVWVPYQSAQNPDMDGDYKAIGGNHDDRILSLAMILTQLNSLIPEEAEPAVEIAPEEQVSPIYELWLSWQGEGGRLNKSDERREPWVL